MKRIMTIALGMTIAVLLSLAMTLLDGPVAEAQGDMTGLLTAGTYVEQPATAGSPRIVVVYDDGNWTLFTPPATSLRFGVWAERAEETPTDTETDTDTDTETSTDTGTGTDSVTLFGSLVDQSGGTLPYTLQFDEMFTSVTVTNTTTQETFQAMRVEISTDTGTGTGTDTGSDTDTGTGTDTDTGTGTDTDTGTSTSTDTETDNGMGTGTDTGT
jgi:hypothetical protein